KIISLNVRGLGSQDKVDWVKELGVRENPIVFGLQETKLKEVDEKFVRRLWNGDDLGFAQVDANGSSGGLITMWNASVFTGTHAVGEVDFLAVVGKWNGVEGVVGLLNIYGPRDEYQRGRLWNRLSSILTSVDAVWCLFGDFNEVRCIEDRLNSEFNERSARSYNDIISDDGMKFSKLDRFLVSGGFQDRWPELSVVALDRKLSDHCPIMLRDKVVNFGPKPFRVFNIWFKERDAEDVVVRGWNKPVAVSIPDIIFRDKLKNVKQELKKWSKEKFGRFDREVESFKQEANKWEREAEKARVKWTVEGDENSKYFHSVVTRRNKNNMRGLMVDGRWSEDPKEIKKGVLDYYKTMFTESAYVRPKLVTNGFKRITEEEAHRLEEKFTEGEVWMTVKNCGSSKSPGPDGFNFKFIKRFWDTNDPIGLKDFRPISLIGCFYKIIAKVLAERIKKVIDGVIGSAQNAFIKGRFILDGVLVADEAVDYLRKSRGQGLIFKIDFEKAYDCMNWDYIRDVMMQMGFGLKWCNWVDACLRLASISILVNGSPTEEFRMTRGIRQGDPLSPFLFLIATEGINVASKEAISNGMIRFFFWE
ncbi:putative RNA-directed DNA polymerase, partial [Tanacetum coccineum]